MTVDKNALLISLSERGRFWKLDFDDLTHPEQVFRAIWELEADVNNGGFHQYFGNSSGDTAFAVVDALETIGAHEMARVVADAKRVFPGSSPPRDWTEREAALDSLSADQEDFLDRLDRAFFAYPDDLTELLYDYVRRNAEHVSGTADVGIGGSGR